MDVTFLLLVSVAVVLIPPMECEPCEGYKPPMLRDAPCKGGVCGESCKGWGCAGGECKENKCVCKGPDAKNRSEILKKKQG